MPAFADVVTAANNYLDTLELFNHITSDTEFIELANRNKLLFKLLRFLLQKQDTELWQTAFSQDNKDELIEALVTMQLDTDPEQFSVCVKAVMSMDQPPLLIKLLDDVLSKPGSIYSNNSGLQNLLLLSTIKLGDKEQVLKYVKRFSAFDVPAIANIAVNAGMIEVCPCLIIV
jgi:clathrin heavy chain